MEKARPTSLFSLRNEEAEAERGWVTSNNSIHRLCHQLQQKTPWSGLDSKPGAALCLCGLWEEEQRSWSNVARAVAEDSEAISAEAMNPRIKGFSEDLPHSSHPFGTWVARRSSTPTQLLPWKTPARADSVQHHKVLLHYSSFRVLPACISFLRLL